MKALKVIGLGVGGLASIVLLGIVAIRLLVDPDHHRAAIEARVRQATGRPFTIIGTIKLEFLPWLALDVGKVTLGNPDGFGAAPELTAERARIGARVLPLLLGRLEVSRVALDGLEVNLVRRADGHTNWETSKQPSSNGPGRVAIPSGASIAGVDVSRATFTFRDEGARSLTRLRDIEFRTGAVGAGRTTDLEFRARLDSGEGTPSTRVELRTRAMFDTDRSLATLTELAVTGERIGEDGKSLPFSAKASQLAFDWNAGTLAPASLELKLGQLAISVEMTGEQLFGVRSIHGRVRIPEQSPRVFAPSLGMTLPVTRDSNAFTRLAGSVAVRLDGPALVLEELDLTLDRCHARGRIAAADIAAPEIEFELRGDSIDIDAYRAATAPAAAANHPVAESPLPLAALRAINARGSVALEHATVGGLPLSGVRITLAARGGDLHLVSAAKAFGGTIAGDVRLDATRESAKLDVFQDIRGVDIGAAVEAYAKSDRLSGRANAAAKLSGSGATDAALIASLAGPIDFEVNDGALEGLDLNYEIGRAQALVQGESAPARSGPARTPFKVLSGHSRLDRGVLATDPVRLEMQALKASGKGTFRLADQAVDYELSAVLQGALPGLTSLRGVEIPIVVTGTVHDYKVRPDLAGVVKGRAKQEIDKRKGELGEKLKDVLKDLIPH